MLKRSLLVLAFVIAACGADNSVAQNSEAGAGAPVAQERANTDFTPAFANQTRAPEQRSVEIATTAIATGLVHPWAIVFLPDGRALVTERPGRLRIVGADGVLSAPIEGLPAVDARDQGGLLDVVLEPSFAQDRLIYWSFSEPRFNGANSTSVARGRLSDDVTRIENAAVIWRQEPAWRSTKHFGSRIVFDNAGHMFVTLGERSDPEPRVLAQDLNADLGKIVRLNLDGSVPSDNPFVGRNGARPEIWSYGHRNVQGADVHPETGELWAIEHGPRGGDEVNVVRAGRNYGWPIISYGEEYSGRPMGEGVSQRDGMEQPIYYWDPVIAPGDLDFYRGTLFPWRGDILIAGLKSNGLVRLRLNGERVGGEEHIDLGARVRDMAEASDGSLWVITDEDSGAVLRLTPRT